jgi:hypothetical protein
MYAALSPLADLLLEAAAESDVAWDGAEPVRRVTVG